MNSGKISEPQCKRSVLKWIPKNQSDIVQGAGIGNDYCAFRTAENSAMVSAMATISLGTSDSEKYALWKAMNKLESSGVRTKAIMVNVILPARGGEERIQKLVRRLAEQCEMYGIDYIGGHTELVETLRAPIITVIAYGSMDLAFDNSSNKHVNKLYSQTQKVKPNQNIVVVGNVGLEATAMIIADHYDELNGRYASQYLDGAKEVSSHLVLRDTYEAIYAWNESENAVSYIHDLSTGGIFAGLWELGEGAKCGIDVMLKSIPIKQETIEVCDYFDVNPYMTLSGGSALVVTDKAELLVDDLHKKDICAFIIGQTTSNNDRIVRNEEARYLTPPKGDDIYKLYN